MSEQKKAWVYLINDDWGLDIHVFTDKSAAYEQLKRYAKHWMDVDLTREEFDRCLAAPRGADARTYCRMLHAEVQEVPAHDAPFDEGW